MIQRYNKLVTAIWRANTDFSPIVDINAIIKYIVKYAAKNECSSKKYMEIIQDLCRNKDKETPAKKIICNMSISPISERDYSAQETAHLLTGWPLHVSSRKFVILSLYQEQWTVIKVKSKLIQF